MTFIDIAKFFTEVVYFRVPPDCVQESNRLFKASWKLGWLLHIFYGENVFSP